MPRMMFTGLPVRFASRIKSAEYDVLLGSPDRPVFRQDGITAPATWSRTAVTVMAQKYFRKAGVPSATRPVYEIEVPTWLQRREPEPGCTFGGETSTAQVHGRLAGGWTYWGWKGGYFEDEGSAKDFHAACLRLLDHQAFAPNSPQYFNMGLFWAYGIAGRPQGQFYVDPASGEVVASTSEYERVSVSACFINTVEDTLVGHDGITDMVTKEARIFRSGAGSGANFSRLRGEGEPLSNGGKSSGMMSFLKVFDTAAGAIKSGGTTRRAAKMAVLDLDHPDVETFIDWKVHEEAKVAAMAAGSALVKAQVALVTAALAAEAAGGPGGAVAAAVATARGLGVPDGVLVRVVELHGEGVAPAVIEYGVDWQSEAYATVSGQNANNSVRVPDAFMHAVEADGDWPLYWRTELTAAAAEGRTPVPCKVLKAKDLWHKVAAAAWACADPGVQFSDTINAWHTSPKGGEIRASNPCSEYLYIDDTSCNLASLNLGKFLDGREFDVDAFHYVTRLVTTILDISVTAGQFPTASIARKTYDYRPIGIGYANLGAMLMRLGLPYDSDSGRWVAAAVTALMQGVALATSAELSDVVGAFPGYADNHRAHQRVVKNHATAAHELVGIYGTYHDLSTTPTVPPVARDLPSFITVAWRAAHEMRRAVDRVGYRNGHLSVLAPTGTISLTMDCQTTGVEPGFSLVSYKSLAGGGSLKLVNAAVGDALRNLGYTPDRVAEILAHVEKTDTIEGCEHLTLDHLAVFDCAVPPASGRRAVSVDGHIKMLAAVQPFLSGAASKTINCPADSTIDDIAGVLFRSWRLMVKAVAVYRDGSKLSQPVTTKLPAAAPPPEPEKAVTTWSVEPTMRQMCDEARGLVVGDPFGVTVAASQPVGDGTSLADVAAGPVIAPPQPSPRRPLPSRRTGYTQKARIGGQKLYLKTGEYEDGTIGELFLTFNKTGTALQGMANAFAVAVSLGLQHGVPLEEFVDAFAFTRFEPSGVVQGDDRIKMASSVVDYVFRELGVTYLRRADLATVPPPAADPQLPPPVVPLVVVVTDDNEADLVVVPTPAGFQKLVARRAAAYDGTPCAVCGAFAMTRSGTCKTCQACGSNTGCG